MEEINAKSAALIARRGATRLLRLVMKDGRFIYRYSAKKDPIPTRDYSALRHCSAAWSMLATARQLGEMAAVAEGAERAIGYLISHHVRPFGNDGSLCVIDNGSIKLGGNGLALLAIIELHALNKDRRLLAIARGLGRYVLSQQRPDGDFIHARVQATLQERQFRSSFYTGQALFGLMRLYEATGDDQWLGCVVSGIDGLLPYEYGVDVQSHWMLYALEALYAVRPSEACLEYARKIAANMLEFSQYRDGGEGTPIACRSEGLLAYVRLLDRADVTTMSPTVSECIREIRTNLELQLACKTANGAFICGGGSDEVRIDHIQHNISSFLAYSRLPPSLTTPSSLNDK